MAKLEDVIQRGNTAGKPAATAVAVGTLYYDTDLSRLERSNGTTWDVVEGTSGIAATIVDAKGDIIAATAADTVSRLAVGSNDTALVADSAQATGLKWAAITDAMLSTSDVATNNASTTKHGFLKKLDNDATHYMDGTGAWTVPPGSGGLTQEQVEDAVAALAVAGTNMTITYNDAVPSLTFDAAGGSGAPTTAKYITTASDGTLSAEVVIPGLAGSADIASAAGAGTSEEFDGSDPFTYAPSSPNTVNVNSTIKSHWYASITDSTTRTAVKTWTPGSGAFDVRACVDVGSDTTSQSNAIQLYIANTALTDWMQIGVQNDAGGTIVIQAYTVPGGAFTQRGTTRTVGTNRVYLRMTRDGSNNVAFYWSGDGNLWVPVATAISYTITVGKVGFRVYTAGAGTMYYSADWLRTSV